MWGLLAPPALSFPSCLLFLVPPVETLEDGDYQMSSKVSAGTVGRSRRWMPKRTLNTSLHGVGCENTQRALMLLVLWL